jgi:hypothetical protein
MNGEIKWTDVPRDDVIAVLNRDMTDDGTIARAREYHHALVNVATAARELVRLYEALTIRPGHAPAHYITVEALRELAGAERAMMVAKGARS